MTNRYRTGLFGAALAGGLAYGAVWYAAGSAPGVHPTPDRFAVPLDDAAIYFQYARQALHGHWLSYYPGEAVSTGVTSPLYFLLITAGMGLGLSGPVCAWLLGMAALLLGLVCADRAVHRLAPGLPRWWAGTLLLTQGSWMAAHFNGLETGLQLGLTWALVDTLSGGADPDTAAFWLVPAALAFTRPEGQVLVVLLGAAWAWPRPGRLAALLALAAAPSVALLAVCGSLVPDSVRPKIVSLGGSALLEHAASASDYAVAVLKGAWMGFWGGADSVGTAGNAAAENPIGPQFPPLALAGTLLGLMWMARGKARALGLGSLAALAALLGLLAWNLPVGWHDFRYLACATPLLYLGMLSGLDALRAGRDPLRQTAASALFVLWVAFGLASWPWQVQRCYAGCVSYALANTNAAMALRNLPPGPVAVVDSGLMAYYSGREIVDLPGITDHAQALANRQGPGAILETLLDRPHPPVYAAFHDHRADFDLRPWLGTGLLRRVADLAQGMGLYQWDFSGARRRMHPAVEPAGRRVLGWLDVADLGDERTQGVVYTGPESRGTLVTRQRLWPDGPLVPEGGRRVTGLTLRAWPTGTRRLLLRAVYARPGTLEAGGPAPGGVRVSVSPAPAGVFSETAVDLPPTPAPGALTLRFVPSVGPGPRSFALYRIWFLD